MVIGLLDVGLQFVQSDVLERVTLIKRPVQHPLDFDFVNRVGFWVLDVQFVEVFRPVFVTSNGLFSGLVVAGEDIDDTPTDLHDNQRVAVGVFIELFEVVHIGIIGIRGH